MVKVWERKGSVEVEVDFEWKRVHKNGVEWWPGGYLRVCKWRLGKWEMGINGGY